MGWKIEYVIENGSSVDPDEFLARLTSQKGTEKNEHISHDDGKTNAEV